MKMKKQLTLETDKKTAKEGEFIDIRWHCSMCPDSLMLILDSGDRTDRLAVSDSGSTRIALPNTKGRFHITIEARCGKKKTREEVAVRVLNVRSSKQKALWMILFALWLGLMTLSICKTTSGNLAAEKAATAYIIK
jgi:hypothetical protein